MADAPTPNVSAGLPATAQDSGAASRQTAGQSALSMTSTRAFMRQPAVQKALPILGLVGAAGALAMVWSVVGAPPSRPLYPHADERDRAAMAEELATAGIAYTLDPVSGALQVSDSDYYRARMQLASQGLPETSPSGTDLMDNLPMGASRAMEQERIRAARQADIARSIEQIDAVQSARVQIAMPQRSAFLSEESQAAASVMLNLRPGRVLGAGQIQAIADLVASSVPGLAAEEVSIVDQRGQSLSRQAGAGAGEADRQLALRRTMESDYARSLSALLTPIVGHGNFTAEVNVDLDFSQVQSTREGAPADGAVLESEETQLTTERAGDAPVAAGGVPGTTTNVPPAPAAVSDTPTTPAPAATPTSDGTTPAEPASGRRTENATRRFVVGREVSVTRGQSPTLKRISVAVALRNLPGQRARSAQEIAVIEQLIQGAVGFSEERGDLVAVTARPFVTEPVVEQPWYETEWFATALRSATAALISLILIFGLFWPLYRRHQRNRQDIAALDVLEQLQGHDSAAARPVVGGTKNVTMEMIEATQGYEARAAMIRAFVRQDPTRAALVVRDLIKGSVGSGARADA